MQRRTLIGSLAAGLFALTACGGGQNTDVTAAADGTASALSAGGGHVSLIDHGPNAVSLWSQVGAATVNLPAAATGTPEERRPNYAFDMATMHVAMYDAAVAITRNYAPLLAPVADAPDLASLPVDAAIYAAAHGVLLGLFPNRAATYQPTYDAAVAALPPDTSTARAIALGAEVARRVLAARADDGRWTDVPAYVPGSAPGDFRGTNPIGLTNPFIRPFVMASASQFRADPPPSLTSDEYTGSFDEVKAWGSATSTVRTAEQTEIARFHTEPPPLFWTRNLRRFASSQPTLVANARLMAMLYVNQADVSVGCFESKYHYNRWRPTSAIRLADTDGNPATSADPTWTPVVPTPNHPEYPAAHACVAATVAETLKQVYGTPQVSFAFDSSVTGQTHAWGSVNDFTKEIADARVWGGMHFRFSTVQGDVLGTKLAKLVGREHFQALK